MEIYNIINMDLVPPGNATYQGLGPGLGTVCVCKYEYICTYVHMLFIAMCNYEWSDPSELNSTIIV